MTAPDPSPPTKSRSTATAPLLGFLIIMTGFCTLLAFDTHAKLSEQKKDVAKMKATMEKILGEVTRARIEQSADGAGPQALLKKLKHYAGLAASSRTTEPDFKNALQEMKSILIAFESIGEDAWKPVTQRLEAAHPKNDFDEIKWLLEAALRVDPKASKQILKDVLLGVRLPFPRLRWWAATLLIREDKQLAQILLRQVLDTESNRGVNPDRMTQYPGMVIPDAAAVATTGFNNFVMHYIHSEDPKTEETLLKLLGRVEHDSITIQECIKELGKRKSRRAVEPIKRLYKNPPLRQQNPLFLIICVRSMHEILGDEANSWLEEVVSNAPTPEVADVARDLLGK